MIIKDNIVAYQPQFLPSTEVAKFCTYKHTSPSGGTYYGRTFGFEFTLEELNENRWGDGSGYGNSVIFSKAIQKYGWDNFKHEVCKTHLFNWECSFVECCGVLGSMSTGHSYNCELPVIGGSSIPSEESKKKNRDSQLRRRKIMSELDLVEESIRQSIVTKKSWEDPVVRQHHIDAARSSVKLKESGKKSLSDPIRLRNLVDSSHTPEANARRANTVRLKRDEISKAVKEAWTPEMRQHMRDLKLSEANPLRGIPRSAEDKKSISDGCPHTIYTLSDGFTGNINEIADHVGLSIDTTMSYCSGGFPQKYNIQIVSKLKIKNNKNG